MGTIAKGEITLSPVNDAYTVLLTPATCTIRADFDGSNPNLENAITSIIVKRGTKAVDFKVTVPHVSVSGIQFVYTQQSDKSIKVAITKIPNSILSGWVSFDIETEDGFHYTTNVQFNFSVVRESTMLDWIQDWEGSKTKVGGTYIMTPKLFVGKKDEVITVVDGSPSWMPGALTGVYIGPDLLNSGENSAGIYGYLKDKEIFHINADGGFVGGWTFNEGGLQSSNGVVNILSEGTIYAQNPKSTTPYWGIYADGHATFANGNVKFMADGSAEFAGRITSQSGTIGGWKITKNQIHSNRIIFDSAEGFIGINATTLQAINAITGDLTFPATPDGGIKMWYNSATNYGLAAWTTGEKVFQLGSYNMIAGWLFNHRAIWTGDTSPSLTQGGYTAENALTMAPNGIRSHKWYIDSNGTASFVGGSVKFNTENAEMFGWLMRDDRFSAKHAAIVSANSVSGIFVSVADLGEVGSSSLIQTVRNHGGIYLYSSSATSSLRAYDTNGNSSFYLSTSGYNKIADWYFDHDTIYIKAKSLTSEGFTANEGSMVLKADGIYGYKWRLLADGSGALAGGKISWKANGDLTVDAKVSANNITTGTISSASILCEGKWALNTDGSGYLASKNLFWDTSGNLFVSGKIEATSGRIAGFQISGNSLTNVGFNNDACIIFRNDAYNVFGAMGGNTLPSSSGLRAVARFENNDSTGFWFSRNIALYLSAQNGTYNHAFTGSGNGTLNGWIGGYRFDRFTLTAANTIYTDYVNLNKNNKWLCKSTVSNAGIALPRLDAVQDALGIGNNTPFCIDLMIMSDIGTNNYFIYGRTDRKDANDKQPWKSEQYPVFVHWDGGRWERQELGAGDCFHVLLIYDPNETQTLDGFSCKYTARVISKQA